MMSSNEIVGICQLGKGQRHMGRSGRDVKEDQRTNNEFMADLNAEYHERALLANQKKVFQKDYKGKYKGLKPKIAVLTKRIDDLTKGKSEKGNNEKRKSDKGLIFESFNWDKESVLSEDEGTTKIKAFMEIAKDEPYVRKTNARSSQWVEITIKKITSDSECETQEPLLPLLMLIGAEPADTSDSLMSLADLTLNMADLILNC
nr:hypothetical protein [Tanacetum cinerariifolium]